MAPVVWARSGSCGKATWQWLPCAGRTVLVSSTCPAGTMARPCPRCPGCPPRFRRLLHDFLPRVRDSPAKPSDDGGWEESVEFCLPSARCRSRPAIVFCCSAGLRRRRSFAPRRRSFSRCCVSPSGRCSVAEVRGGGQRLKTLTVPYVSGLVQANLHRPACPSELLPIFVGLF